MTKEWIAVALGGMSGALMRHVLSWLFVQIGPAWLPIATLTANAIGCFAIGVLAEWAHFQSLTREWWVVGLRVGLLGGLTTYSVFALDIVRLWNPQRPGYSIAFVASHLVLGVAAVVLGIFWVRSLHPVE